MITFKETFLGHSIFHCIAVIILVRKGIRCGRIGHLSHCSSWVLVSKILCDSARWCHNHGRAETDGFDSVIIKLGVIRAGVLVFFHLPFLRGFN